MKSATHLNHRTISKCWEKLVPRGIQRLLVTEIGLRGESGQQSTVRMLLNDWVEVQENYYRYLAIDDVWGIAIRIVISEYLACEIAWRSPAN